MKLDISAEEFQNLSSEKKKKYIANLLINESGSESVGKDGRPVAFIMAGLPGAGKTEYLDSLSDLIADIGKFGKFVRIDLDQIVAIYPEYTPKDYYKFRNAGNVVLARCIDVARRGRYNVMIDGTFSGKTGASVDTVSKLLHDGYIVILMYMYDKAETAWMYTQKREQLTDRGVSKEGFIEASRNISRNLQKVVLEHRDNPNFAISVVVQKELRDKFYTITTEKYEVDKIINKPYNIDKL